MALPESKIAATLAVLFLILTAGCLFGSSTETGPLGPDAEWTWEESTDEIVLTHDGGDPVDVSTISIQLRPASSEDSNESSTLIKDLTNQQNHWIITPFPDDTVRSGDALTLNKDGICGYDIALLWEQPDGNVTATLALYDPC